MNRWVCFQGRGWCSILSYLHCYIVVANFNEGFDKMIAELANKCHSCQAHESDNSNDCMKRMYDYHINVNCWKWITRFKIITPRYKYSNKSTSEFDSSCIPFIRSFNS